MSSIFLGHISDLHIGGKEYKNQIASSDLPVLKYRQSDNPHDDVLCRKLTSAWDDVRIVLNISDDDPLYLAVTGDLTRRGSRSDFELSKNFVESSWSKISRIAVPPGLNQATDLGAIPGNHDQWSGLPYWLFPAAYNRVLFRSFFGDTIWGPVSLMSKNDRLMMEVFGIDSNSGKSGFSFFQGGKISTKHGKTLEKLLKNAPKTSANTECVVRVILCHHSFDNVFGTPRPLDHASREALLDLAEQYNVAVVLTGHTHYADHKKYFSKKDPNKPIWEIRAPSALQAPPKAALVPPHRGVPGIEPAVIAHGFWVHQIELEDGSDQPTWWAHKFDWNGRIFLQRPRIKISIA